MLAENQIPQRVTAATLNLTTHQQNHHPSYPPPSPPLFFSEPLFPRKGSTITFLPEVCLGSTQYTAAECTGEVQALSMGGEAPLFGAAGDVEMDMDIDLDTHGSMYAEGPFAVPTLSQGPEAQEYAGESPLCSPKKKHRVQRVDSETEPPKKRRKKKRRIVINSTYCKYDCVRRVAADWDWIEDANEDGEKGEFNVFWTDTSVAIFRVMRLQNWQRINHFPSMHTIARKVQLSNTLSKMRKMFPQHFSFSPRTWSLKSERSIFKKFCQSLPQKRTFIIKPSAGCQGKGIFLTQDPQDIDEELEDAVAQEYIQRPLLIEQKKFDIRVYCLVTSMKYPSIFMFDEGLVRLCTADYQKPSEENCEDLLMHLTNYAINKTSDKFVFNEDADHGDVGHKRDFNFLNKWLRSQGHDVEKVWARIDKVVVKTLLAAQPILSHVYTSCFPHNNDGYTCFEILGFDLLLDSQLKPWLLEVNHSPSFACYTPLDDRIKTGLVREAASILNLKNDDRIREREREKEEFKRRMDSQARRAAIKKCGGDESELKALEAKELEEERKRQEQFVIKKRADEDASLQHFRRCYPSPDPARQVHTTPPPPLHPTHHSVSTNNSSKAPKK